MIFHIIDCPCSVLSFPSFRLSSISPTLLNSSARTLYRASWADVVATGWTPVFLSLSLYFVFYILYLVFLLLRYVVHFEQKLLERWTPADFLSSNLLNWPHTLIVTRCHCKTPISCTFTILQLYCLLGSCCCWLLFCCTPVHWFQASPSTDCHRGSGESKQWSQMIRRSQGEEEIFRS